MDKGIEQLNKRMYTDRHKRGSIIVDAAISIPIFVLSMCFLLSMIIHVGREETAMAKMLKLSQSTSIACAASGMDIVDELVLTDEGHFLLYRPFVGKTKNIDDMVYIFPKSGQRYHIDGCSTLKEGEITSVLTNDIRRRYKPCKICDPDKLPNGSSVYVYSDSTHVYHRQSCSTITKNYECVTKEDAILKGYTPCQICLKNLKEILE